MKIAIMQPYLFPYIGYFQLIKAVDKFVIYDDVNYIKKGWINRNDILVNNQKYLFTVSLDSSSQNKLINEILIKDDFVKLLKTIYFSYKKAPYFKQTYALLEEILSFQERNLSKFVTKSLTIISRYLGMKTEFIISSTLQKDTSLKGKDKILYICDKIGSKSYYNLIGGLELYDKSEFFTHNIDLKYIKAKPVFYKQFDTEFIPNLSIIDVMMFNSMEGINSLLDNYELI